MNNRWQRAAWLKQRDKTIIALYIELTSLHNLQRTAPLEPLAEPYQQGWQRSFVFRSDISRRKDAPLLDRILKAINHHQYSRRKDFRYRQGGRGKIWVTIGIKPKLITQNQWQKHKFPDSYKKYFYIRHSYRFGKWLPEYHFRHPWMLELDLQPRMITHRRVIQPDIERQISELDELFDQNHYYEKYYNLRGTTASWSNSRTHKLQRQMKQEAEEAISEYLHHLIDHKQR